MTIGFVNPEAAVVRVLKQAGLVASVTAPQTIPDGYVRVQSAGGPWRRLVLSQRLVQIFAHAKSRAVAGEYAERAVAALVAAPRAVGEPVIRAVDVVGEPSYYPDPDTGAARYTATVAIILRGQ